MPHEAEIKLGLVNLERTNHGLSPLASRGDVVEYATAHSAAMAAAGAIWHNDDYFTRTTKSRFGASMVGENVAVNTTTADAHRRLMNSPGHRANILEPSFTHVGIAIVRSDEGQLYFTQDFLKSTGPAATAAPASAPAPEPAPPAPAEEPVTPQAPTGNGTAPIVRAPRAPVATVPPAPAPNPGPVPTPSAPVPPDPAVTVPGPDAVLSQTDAATDAVTSPDSEIAAGPPPVRKLPPTLAALRALLVLTGLAGVALTTRYLLRMGDDLTPRIKPR